jgi:predicted nucleic acid-binding protein
VEGSAVLLTSAEVEDELAAAPERVRLLFKAVPASHREEVLINDEVNDLADAYLSAGVVSARSREDCLHVAAATVNRADAIVSWNFKHIVRLDRIHSFNAVNVAAGYGIITILSPKEVNLDE